jgi:hypothetical protein
MRIGLLTRRFVNPYTPSRALAEDKFTAASVRGCSEIRPARIQRGHARLHALGARQVRLALPHRVAHPGADFRRSRRADPVSTERT